MKLAIISQAGEAANSYGTEGFSQFFSDIAKGLKRTLNKEELTDKDTLGVKGIKDKIKKTLGNESWLSSRDFVEGEISAAGILDLLQLDGKIDPTNVLGQLTKQVESIRWWEQWLPDLIKWEKTITETLAKTEEEINAAKDDAEVIRLAKAATKALAAIPKPSSTFLKYAKPTIEGAPAVNKGGYPDFKAYPPTGIEKMPALTASDLKTVARWVVDMVEDKDHFSNLSKKFNRYPGCDFEDWVMKIRDADEDVYMDFMDQAYHQSLWDYTWEPWSLNWNITNALLKWVARSVK